MEKNCGTCVYLEPNNSREHSNFSRGTWKTYHCKECGGYHELTESPCRYYQPKPEESSNCFITTLVVNILGYDDNCSVLNCLRDFRDKVLQVDPSKLNLLLQYDVVGPLICDQLERDCEKKELSVMLMKTYIMPTVSFIQHKQYDLAIDRYTRMVKFLKNRYQIADEIIKYEYNPGVDRSLMGKGRKLLTRLKKEF